MADLAPPDPQLLLAATRRRDARERMKDTAGALQARLKPGQLARDAATGLRRTSADLADRSAHFALLHPGVVAGTAVAIVLLALRRPLLARITRRSKPTAVPTTPVKQPPVQPAPPEPEGLSDAHPRQ